MSDDPMIPIGDNQNFEPDINPTLIGRVNLVSDGSLYADVYSTADFYPQAELLDFTPLIDYFDRIENNVRLFETTPLPDSFDYNAKTVRGPFYFPTQVDRFLDKSGLRGIAIPYYDDSLDEYWIDVNTE